MKNTIKEIIRWSIVVLCGGFGLWMLVDGGYSILQNRSDAFAFVFGLFFTALIAGVPLLLAHMAFHRQYHRLIIAGAAIASLILWVVLGSLVE